MIEQILAATIRQATPLLIVALGEIISERAGVINIGLEGIMILGAFVGWIGSFYIQSASVGLAPWMGILLGALSGMTLAGLFAILILGLKADQVVTGTGINLLAFGVVEVLYRRIFGATGKALKVAIFQPIHLPLLSKIPLIGPILFQHNLLVYAAFIAVPLVYFYLFHTHHGLAIQACGEYPKSADTVGINVGRLQAKCVLFGGFMAGIAGGYLSLADVPYFSTEMTAGRGFIALSIVIFGKWHPVKACGAALLFGLGSALPDRLQAIPDLGFIPYQFFLMLPYVLTLLVLAGFVGRASPPAALALPYRRE
ncbi:MAG: ABC transporter permease [Candidatus Poribacteria bacterium]|nr:ABC transporter permease [Candidatus Poribacteria bacterium]